MASRKTEFLYDGQVELRVRTVDDLSSDCSSENTRSPTLVSRTTPSNSAFARSNKVADMPTFRSLLLSKRVAKTSTELGMLGSEIDSLDTSKVHNDYNESDALNEGDNELLVEEEEEAEEEEEDNDDVDDEDQDFDDVKNEEEGLGGKNESNKQLEEDEKRFKRRQSIDVKGTFNPKSPYLPTHGVTIELIRRIRDCVKISDPECTLSTSDVNDNFILPWTASKHCSLIDLLIEDFVDKDHPLLHLRGGPTSIGGLANVFVTHAWSYTFDALVTSLECLYDKIKAEQESREEIYFWLDICVLNQWTPITGHPVPPSTEWWTTSFVNLIRNIGHTCLVLLPWHKPVSLSRSWCLFELYATHLSGAKFTIQFSKKRHDYLLEILADNYEDGIKLIPSRIMVESSRSMSPAIRNVIMEVFVQTDEGYHGVNVTIYALILKWIRETTIQKIKIRIKIALEEGEALQVNQRRNTILPTGYCEIFCDAFGCKDFFDFTEAIKTNHQVQFGYRQQVAFLLSEHGEYAESEEMYNKALEWADDIVGKNHPCTLSILGNLALLYKKQKKYEEAEKMYLRALTSKEHILGQSHPSTLVTVQNLAVFFKETGRQDSALLYFTRALTDLEVELGENHAETLHAVENLAAMYLELGKEKDAEKLLMRSLNSKIKKYGKNHPETIVTLETLATLYAHEERFEEARVTYENVLTVRETLNGLCHPTTLNTCHRLSRVHKVLTNYIIAERLMQRVLAGTEKLVGTAHYSLYEIMDTIADLNVSNQLYDKAEEMYISLLSQVEDALGPNDPITLTTNHHLGDLFALLERYEEAEVYFRRAFDGRMQLFGKDKLDTLLSQYGLANALAYQKKYKESYRFFREALTGFDSHVDCGLEHRYSLAAVESLAAVSKISGDRRNAEELLQRLVASYNKVLGPQHTSTLAAVASLASIYQNPI